jgi:SAM-dependent methyltransferase
MASKRLSNPLDFSSFSLRYGEDEFQDAREQFYNGRDYLDGYIAHTNDRVKHDAHEAVGGMWEEIGALQFDFLVAMGLRPEHRFLDIGCGTLRGGRKFIRYLGISKYTGLDISPACLDAARTLIEREKLATKKPRLVLSTNKDMKFSQFSGLAFDFILAQSVFTHLPDYVIRECFEHIGKIMHNSSVFFFTYFQSGTQKRRDVKTFAYPWAFFDDLAKQNTLKTVDVSHLYAHPRGQRMGRITSDRRSRSEPKPRIDAFYP